MKQYDIVCLGELLIDFSETAASNQEHFQFNANPGGAPANIAAMAARLGCRTAFIGKLGQDFFAPYLIHALQAQNIDTTAVVCDPDWRTTLAFVKNSADGDREFAFFRQPGADSMLSKADIDTNVIKGCRIFHFGSLSLTNEPVRSATAFALQQAKAESKIISFDPNFRQSLWGNDHEAREQIEWGCTQCDILKISEDELRFLTDIDDLDHAMVYLKTKYENLKLVFLTLGKEGSRAYLGETVVHAPTFPDVKTIDTTGAGDCFFASCLAGLPEGNYENMNAAELKDLLRFANAAASIITTRKGALSVMPSEDEIKDLIQSS